ncbi:sugar transferase [Desulfoscipio sp. XC116]|uniref:sugar transferase n=1 Tax=Desulfoscipio sp. XC116 TaxID=3144975 RepID=UPI00325B7883
MILRKWEDLPDNMKKDSVKKYYDSLYKKRLSLLVKRIFDVVIAIFTFIMLSPVFIIISIAIKMDSKGPVMFRQVRVTQYGKQFKIFKFRTMVNNADKIGAQITAKNDIRVTKVGNILRKFRLDEVPQLFNIVSGDMSFVGTRPEVVRYVDKYTDEMMATLLLPAGVTSEASIQYKNEEQLLANADDVDEAYVNDVLPKKMKYNLRSIDAFSFLGEIKTMFRTVIAVINSYDKSGDSFMVVNSDRKFHRIND